MAYITTANANSIIYKIDVNSLDLQGELYKRPIYFFNKYEKNSLLAIKELFLDSEKFYNEYYKPIITKDTFNFVFEGKPPAYHKSIDCNRISSDYENFQIPESIKEKGKETVIKFRKWFLENQYLLSKPDIFIARLQMRWGIVSNLKNINKENSGFTEFENFTPKQIEEKIDSLIIKAGKLYYEETEILKRFNKYAYLGNKESPIKNNNTGFSDKKVKEVLSYFEDNIKKPLRPLLIQYFRVTINPELNLNDRILEQLGFKPCSQCYKFKITTPSFNAPIPRKHNTNNTVNNTYIETYNYIQKGYNIGQIAKLRGFSESTIVNHIEKLGEVKSAFELENIKPNQVIINKVQRAILITKETETLKPIFMFLNETISYNDIRLAKVFINI